LANRLSRKLTPSFLSGSSHEARSSSLPAKNALSKLAWKLVPRAAASEYSLGTEVAAGATHAVVSKWLVEEGSEVSVGQVIVELETDKAVVEYAAEEAGKLSKIIAGDGVEVEVGAPIAIIGEDASSGVESPSSPEPEESAPVPTAPPAPIATPIVQDQPETKSEAPKQVVVDPARRFVSPVARKMASDAGLDLSQVVAFWQQFSLLLTIHHHRKRSQFQRRFNQPEGKAGNAIWLGGVYVPAVKPNTFH
jgi:biotin carboxyl carrier protein